ncbi:hypothetical protein AAVH_22010 [Aphelenchoides avenae]|nr:hypothetical protein AAVH_22010 [Aphelenchus avenae]
MTDDRLRREMMLNAAQELEFGLCVRSIAARALYSTTMVLICESRMTIEPEGTNTTQEKYSLMTERLARLDTYRDKAFCLPNSIVKSYCYCRAHLSTTTTRRLTTKAAATIALTTTKEPANFLNQKRQSAKDKQPAKPATPTKAKNGQAKREVTPVIAHKLDQPLRRAPVPVQKLIKRNNAAASKPRAAPPRPPVAPARAQAKRTVPAVPKAKRAPVRPAQPQRHPIPAKPARRPVMPVRRPIAVKARKIVPKRPALRPKRPHAWKQQRTVWRGKKPNRFAARPKGATARALHAARKANKARAVRRSATKYRWTAGMKKEGK